jgi:hypothetical protein
MAVESRSKRDELKTYRLLGIPRDRKFEKRPYNKKRFLGGDCIERPVVMLNEVDYLKLWKSASATVLSEYKQLTNQKLPREVLWIALRKKIEDRLYEMALENYLVDASLDQKCKQLGLEHQSSNKQEKYSYQDVKGQSGHPLLLEYGRYREALLDEVLSKIETKSHRSPQFLQTLWSDIVGNNLSLQSQIHSIDEKSGTLYIRVIHPSVGHHLLQQKTAWWKRLETKFGMKFKKLVIQ